MKNVVFKARDAKTNEWVFGSYVSDLDSNVYTIIASKDGERTEHAVKRETVAVSFNERMYQTNNELSYAFEGDVVKFEVPDMSQLYKFIADNSKPRDERRVVNEYIKTMKAIQATHGSFMALLLCDEYPVTMRYLTSENGQVLPFMQPIQMDENQYRERVLSGNPMVDTLESKLLKNIVPIGHITDFESLEDIRESVGLSREFKFICGEDQSVIAVYAGKNEAQVVDTSGEPVKIVFTKKGAKALRGLNFKRATTKDKDSLNDKIAAVYAVEYAIFVKRIIDLALKRNTGLIRFKKDPSLQMSINSELNIEDFLSEECTKHCIMLQVIGDEISETELLRCPACSQSPCNCGTMEPYVAAAVNLMNYGGKVETLVRNKVESKLPRIICTESP